jgi:2-polyprenyl-3-methyl-5-hydroxy-6-metoxy-1,4-benzoquinol methylase
MVFSENSASQYGGKCPVCASTTNNVLADTLRRGRGVVLKCDVCDLGFLVADAKPDLKTYYDKEYREVYSHRSGKSATNAEEIYNVYSRYQQDRLRLITHLLHADSEVLEVGASAGQFISHLDGLCKRRCAIELDSECCAFMSDRFHIETDNNFIRESRFSGQKFDLVCAFQVMEHTEDPVSFIRDIRSVLKPGGTAFIEVPNLYDPLLTIWDVREYHPFYYHSAHIFYFSEKSLRMLANKAGFDHGKIEMHFLQDYNLLNHLHWIMNGVPQATCHTGLSPVAIRGNDPGLSEWLTKELSVLNENYINRLVAMRRTSNIMMVLRNDS